MPSVPAINDPGCKARLLRHLDQCILEIDTEICPMNNIPTTTTSQESKNDNFFLLKKTYVTFKKKNRYLLVDVLPDTYI